MSAIETLRTELRSFLGEENFRKLLPETRMIVGREPRLRFWQEQILSRCFAARSSPEPSPEEVAAALRVCPVHNIELHQGPVSLFRGNLDFAPDYVAIRQRCFPHASTDPVSTEGAPFEGNELAVWLCSECQAKAKARLSQSEA